MGASGGDGAGIGGAREAGLSNNVPNNHNTRNETMPLILVGLGLGDAKDITLRGLEAVKSADKVYLEAYTSILCGENSKQSLEALYGREVILADREFVETDNNEILDEAESKTVALLVVGDPFGATTHSDMALRANKRGIKLQVIHNASIMNAVAACGLQLYSFGETVSIPLWEESWRPFSFFDKIISNKRNGLHTLCLLDIKVKEKSLEALMKGKEVYEPPRFMTTAVAAQQLLEIISSLEKEASEESNGKIALINSDTLCVGLARVGSESQEIVSCSLKEMASRDLGKPLHSLVVPGHMHPLEEDMLRLYSAQ